MSQLSIPGEGRKIIKLPCLKNNWIELNVHSENDFSLYIVKESDLRTNGDINIEEQNFLSYTGNSYERVLTDGVQFLLILINDGGNEIVANVSIKTIPIKYTNDVGPLSAFH